MRIFAKLLIVAGMTALCFGGCEQDPEVDMAEKIKEPDTAKAERQVYEEKAETDEIEDRELKEPKAHVELIEAIGPKLVYADGREAPADVLAEKDYVLLYFSAEWCGPCRTFTPLIVEFYKEYAEKGNLEVVLVSSDRTEEAMLSYMKDYDMDWPAVPFDRRRESGLSQTHGVRGIPRLIALDAAGEAVKDSARDGRGAMLSALGEKF